MKLEMWVVLCPPSQIHTFIIETCLELWSSEIVYVMTHTYHSLILHDTCDVQGVHNALS